MKPTLANYIALEARLIEDTVQKSLDDASGLDDWSVNATYECSLSRIGVVTDLFTVNVTFYEDGDNKEKGTFTFTSQGAVFLTDRCNEIYQKIIDPTYDGATSISLDYKWEE